MKTTINRRGGRPHCTFSRFNYNINDKISSSKDTVSPVLTVLDTRDGTNLINKELLTEKEIIKWTNRLIESIQRCKQKTDPQKEDNTTYLPHKIISISSQFLGSKGSVNRRNLGL